MQLAAALLPLVVAGDAMAASKSWLAPFGDMDLHRRLWMAAIGGFSLAAAFAMLAFELRARRIAIALRRLTDLAASVDGRLPEETRRQRISVELGRLSEEILYASQRMYRERRELTAKAASWEAIFAGSLEASMVLDKTGAVTHVNPAAERLLRFTAQEVIGKPLADVMLPPAHRSPENASFASDLTGGRATGRRQELVAQRHDGRQFPLEVTVAEFNNGDQTCYIVSARDISTHRRLRAELARARDIQPAASKKSAPRTAYTVEEICGEPIRRLAARAERKGLRFRYEDTELQGLALIGNAARLRRVLANLIDNSLHVCDSGELIVHLTLIPLDERELRLSASVTATGMSDEQAAILVQPYLVQPVAGAGSGSAVTDRRIEFFGARVMVARAAGGGITFQFNQRFEADLSRVAIDLSTEVAMNQPAPGEKRAIERKAPMTQQDRADFAGAAVRLRKNADKGNLGALWAESHRLTAAWQRHANAPGVKDSNGSGGSTGLVSALSHAARGGDTVNAAMLARRLADALEVAASQGGRRHAETEVAHHAAR
ncbi:MAG: PAS domain S-box protein [Pseudomonadota bacterium]|nr:PAS domain S-box protein [Pseudomonadota bacterium]